MARPSQDPQIRITEILNAAEPLFYSKGYHETAISDIAQKMGVAQGTIYYYFKSKEELLEALINRVLSDIMSQIKILIHSSNISSHNKMQVAIQTLFQSLYRDDGLVFEFLYNDRTIHILDKLARQGDQLFSPLLLEIIEEGNREHYFNAAHPQAVVNIVLSILDSLIEAIYKKVPAELLRYQFELAEDLIETALGVEKDTIHIVINNEL
ncbi:TetR/AcrR family transcriptional regulator [Sporomusa malonica]|uniref:Transcriptional regulator, TetR family n=1 Tax=Sporomusa malonica TaxID=112901 RepID=A0A1W1YAR1_9FIRM|nr:TetR/AcrR family transcriptional regulator [Sporomusa malonica]SMC33246.1 transcriptional regulator, TetR family [Sporomusa malonica]